MWFVCNHMTARNGADSLPPGALRAKNSSKSSIIRRVSSPRILLVRLPTQPVSVEVFAPAHDGSVGLCVGERSTGPQ